MPLDFVLLCAMLVIVGIGLFRGLSGELGSVTGFAAALAAGYFLYGAARGCAASFGFAARGETMMTGATAVIDFVFALVAFGMARWTVAKFVSCLIPQPTDALLGALGGLFKCLVLVALVTGVGFLRPGGYSRGPAAAYSVLIRQVAAWADAYAGGGAE